MALLVVADHTISKLSAMNVILRLLEAAVEFVCWWGGGLVVDWWGLQCHFHVQPNYSVEVVLC